MVDQPEQEQAAQAELPNTLWQVYAELARARYKQEEDRWQAGQDKARAVFAVAAIVGGLVFSKVDWALTSVQSSSYYALWYVLFVLAGAALFLSLILSAIVLAPRRAFGLEQPHETIGNLKTWPNDGGPEYTGKMFDNVVQANAAGVDRVLGLTQWAVWLLIASLVLALLQLLTVVSASSARPTGAHKMTQGDPDLSAQFPLSMSGKDSDGAAKEEKPAKKEPTPSPILRQDSPETPARESERGRASSSGKEDKPSSDKK